MNDEYTGMKIEFEFIAATIIRLRYDIRMLVKRFERSDHPLKREYIARLERWDENLIRD